MASVLLRQFTQGRNKSFISQYKKVFGMKTPTVLDKIIPDISGNLQGSSRLFIEALINLDTEFVQNTSTPALKRILIPDMQKLKSNKTLIKQVDNDSKRQQIAILQKKGMKIPENMDFETFTISPYVIFGQTMEERLKLDDPWSQLYFLMATNRFLNAQALSDGGNFIKRITQQHVYGFNCYYHNFSKDIEVVQGTATKDYDPQQFVVTFETNAENQEFYVSDFNYLVKDSV